MIDSRLQALIDREFACFKENDVIFLNTSYGSVPPLSVREAYKKYFITPTEICGKDLPSDNAAYKEAKEGLAAIIGCAPTEIAFMHSVARSMNSFAGAYPWQQGDEIVMPAPEHGANKLPWINAVHRGAVLKPVHPDPATGITADAVIAACTDKTKVVAVSMVQYVDGARLDMYKLGDFCHENGIILVVDAIQAIGKMEIDVKAMHIDFLAASCYKGLLGHIGGGFLYCHDELAAILEPEIVSYTSVETRANMHDPVSRAALQYHPSALRFESGTKLVSSHCAMAAGTKLLLEIGIKNIESRVLGLQGYLWNVLGALGVEMTARGDLPSGIVTVYFPAEKRDEVNALIESKRIICSVRGDNVRFSINFFNNEAEMEVLASVIRDIKAF